MSHGWHINEDEVDYMVLNTEGAGNGIGWSEGIDVVNGVLYFVTDTQSMQGDEDFTGNAVVLAPGDYYFMTKVEAAGGRDELVTYGGDGEIMYVISGDGMDALAGGDGAELFPSIEHNATEMRTGNGGGGDIILWDVVG